MFHSSFRRFVHLGHYEPDGRSQRESLLTFDPKFYEGQASSGAGARVSRMDEEVHCAALMHPTDCADALY